MTEDEREVLIEEAAKAILVAAECPKEHWLFVMDSARRDAEAALDVFERAAQAEIQEAVAERDEWKAQAEALDEWRALGAAEAARKAPWWHDQGVGIVQGSHWRGGFEAGAAWAGAKTEAADSNVLSNFESRPVTDEMEAAQAYADATYPESKLAPENEGFAEIAEAAFIAGARFRRPVQGEPTDAMVEAFLLEEWKHEGWGYDGGDDLPYCECGHMLGAGLERPTVELDRHRVRAALEAALGGES